MDTHSTLNFNSDTISRAIHRAGNVYNAICNGRKYVWSTGDVEETNPEHPVINDRKGEINVSFKTLYPCIQAYFESVVFAGLEGCVY